MIFRVKSDWMRFGLRVGLGAGALMLVSGPVMAMPVTSLDGAAGALGMTARYPVLTSAGLAGIRGKYVDGANVVYFGLQMVSSWQTGQGDSMTVGTDIGIGTVQGRPSVTFASWSKERGGFESATQPGNRTASGSLAGHGQGVTQGIQVAGDGNQVSNQADVQVGPSGAITPLAASGPGVIEPNLVVVKGGAVGTVSVGGNGVSLGITLPGFGSVNQQLGVGGISQNAQVVSNANQVTNQLLMRVGTTTGTPMIAQRMGLLLQGIGALAQ
ncbi:hypothetical protein Thpro_022362 [Acidihalobacter prosperus]|uniref:Uncharacterized protein n=2 Tax=Acidihalobacter prosperus TaxID=160660 RepID=A0A1A6C0L9_9GAMM|nr:hypothetical protein Thpro_022362 [Acidihalobacter prosperus]